MSILKAAMGYWRTVALRCWPWLLFFCFGGLLLEEWMLKAAQVPPGAREPSMVLTLATVFVMILWALVGNLLLTMIAAREVWVQSGRGQLPKILELTAKYWEPLTLESIRALGWTLIWSLALIIPGIVVFLKFLFVPYVVLFEEEYHEGKIDALARSRQLTQGRLLKIFVFNLIFWVLILGLQGVAQGMQWNLFNSPIMATISQAVLQLLSLFAAILMFIIYLEAKDNGSARARTQ